MRYWATSVALGALVAGLRAQTAEPSVSVLPARPDVWKYSGLYSVSGNQTALRNWNAGGQSSLNIGVVVRQQLKYTRNRLSSSLATTTRPASRKMAAEAPLMPEC